MSLEKKAFAMFRNSIIRLNKGLVSGINSQNPVKNYNKLKRKTIGQ